jgi:hypothetical protein
MLIDVHDLYKPKVISLFGIYLEGCYEVAISYDNRFAYLAGHFGLRVITLKSDIILNISMFMKVE